MRALISLSLRFVGIVVLLHASPPASPPLSAPCQALRDALLAEADPNEEKMLLALDQQLTRWSPTLTDSYCHSVLDNLLEKRASGQWPSAEEVVSKAIDFEGFRLQTYLDTGVWPKRYFGFLDEQGDTAEWETLLRETLQTAVPIANRYAAGPGLAVSLSEKEVATTFLAEGGALLLTANQDRLDRIHPISDMGLDSFAEGFDRYRELLHALGRNALRTDLSHIRRRQMLYRPMTFQEAVVATTRYCTLYEKGRAAEAFFAAQGIWLAGQALPWQFVATSLVYNAGISFSVERVDQIVALQTADYLVKVNAENFGKRPALAVFCTAEASAKLESGEDYPAQPTSWNAVYHVLQRYGAWVALANAGQAFDAQGNFAVLEH